MLWWSSDALFYTWWGHRASENISFIQREIADDEVIYHFITGSPSHGHTGRIVFTGRVVHEVSRRRWDDRRNRIKAAEMIEAYMKLRPPTPQRATVNLGALLSSRML